MLKLGKSANAELTTAAWNACKDLPEAPQTLIDAASAHIQDSKNPAPPGTGQDAMDGHAGSISRAFNTIALHCVGYRVPVSAIKIALASHVFDTSKGLRSGLYNPNHTTDLVFEKRHANGLMVLSSGKGWVAVNPEWYKLLTGVVVSPMDTTPTAVAPAVAPAVKSADSMTQAKGLGKAARKAASKKQGKPQTARQLEASLAPTSADLKTGKAIASK